MIDSWRQKSGKDTPHDTVGIAYQVMSTDLATTTPSTLLTSPLLEDQAAEPISSNDKRKRRRAYEPKGMFTQPYRKKPRMLTSKFSPSNDARREMHEIKCNTASETWKKDILWMSNFAMDPNFETPLWAGWNYILQVLILIEFGTYNR